MHMNGGEVFKFATRVIGESITQALDIAKLTLDDVTLIVPHQANARILQAAARVLKVDAEIFVSNVEYYGNTSAASIPIALCEAIDQERIHHDDNIVFVGFGGGLTWASMVVKWIVPETVERRTLYKQRRQFSYFAARWRRRIIRWSRAVGEWFSRFRPERGRIRRLRRKIDYSEID
jgi:3-oxoacyl-[acyl-carrier-protein] synthase-3